MGKRGLKQERETEARAMASVFSTFWGKMSWKYVWYLGVVGPY